MKQNMIKAMDNLEVDEGIRGLIGKMWKHGYDTLYSCAGHDPTIYHGEQNNTETGVPERIRIVDTYIRHIVYRSGTGDGWFEKNATKLGFIDSRERTVSDPQDGSRVMSQIYAAGSPYETELPDGDTEINWNAILKYEETAA